jgi:hypothetical protein
MELSEWLRTFRALHDLARRGQLSGRDHADYLGARDELARAMLAMQKLEVPKGSTPRQALRVSRALQVDLETPISAVRATTKTLSLLGFSALVAKPPGRGEELQCSLRMPGGAPVLTTARLLDARQLAGASEATFAFGRLEDADRERLELLVFDTVLEQLAV